ncbi:origin recognition complex subunit 2-like isoform X2 [Dinothrombium tinctorium]|uniref:Origin recognition complex subunit 2 n=1 Tax=Dinothrombium tinctorium TaxID=1965070 RepID=A0A443RCI1_9ACAR|nr:origin recognition complex subunit 2-like isoform X2 [Dinothrombium tinctorium]RWS12960.1 origin recognition complex subunit 2-like isoform X2 [Dinothrombium tinctorium]
MWNQRLRGRDNTKVDVLIVDESYKHERVVDITEDASDTNDEERDEEEDEQLDDHREDKTALKRSHSKTISRAANDSSDNEEPADGGNQIDYFTASSQRTKRSQNNFNDIDLQFLQNMNEDEFQMHGKEKEDLLQTYKTELFSIWFELMLEGFNVILYGFGSKKAILDKFREEWLMDEHHLIIFGYFTELNLKQIIGCLKEALNFEKSDESSILQSASEMKNDLYLVIHSMDFLFSTNKKIKSFIRQLMVASNNKIHILASVDHIHSGLLWSSHESHQLNWIWYETHTFLPFKLERGYCSSILSSNLNSMLSQYLTLSSIEHVYDSLTPNAKKIFILIAKYYLKNVNASVADNVEMNDDECEEMVIPDPNFDGLAFSTLYRQCREEFLVNSEITLRTQLTEFKDHKLIKTMKSLEGTEIIALCIDLSLVKKFVNKVERS